jgi:hypothetical protein
MNIVLIHIGIKRFDHLKGTLNQLLYFNNNKIHLIANKKVLKNLNKFTFLKRINFVDIDTLQKDYFHKSFLKKTRLSRTAHDGFWIKTMERFFYIDNFAKTNKLENIIHIENDVLVFYDLDKYKKKFKKLFDIGFTFLNSNTCVPGFIYFKSYKSITKLTNYIYKKNKYFFQKKNLNDMQLLGNFYNENKEKIKVGLFPTVTKELALRFIKKEERVNDFFKNYKYLNIIFDACALGQKIDGLDKKYHLHKGSFNNELNIINPKNLEIIFKIKNKVRFPFLRFKKKFIPIMNLHLHSKKTNKFVKLPSTET